MSKRIAAMGPVIHDNSLLLCYGTSGESPVTGWYGDAGTLVKRDRALYGITVVSRTVFSSDRTGRVETWIDYSELEPDCEVIGRRLLYFKAVRGPQSRKAKLGPAGRKAVKEAAWLIPEDTFIWEGDAKPVPPVPPLTKQ